MTRSALIIAAFTVAAFALGYATASLVHSVDGVHEAIAQLEATIDTAIQEGGK